MFNRIKNVKQAKEHTNSVEKRYGGEIANCIKETMRYDEKHVFAEPSATARYNQTEIVLSDLDATSALIQYGDIGKTAVLNFANYIVPGGMYMDGSSGQEEHLCRESFLYNVLLGFNDSLFKQNKKEQNRYLYLNRALYSPDVIFERNGEQYKVDVISCAAPNKKKARKITLLRGPSVSLVDHLSALQEREEFVLNVAAENKVDTLILGAFGCGAFGQDPYDVANIFKYLISDKFNGCFKKVVFAVPDSNSENYKAFEDVLYHGATRKEPVAGKKHLFYFYHPFEYSCGFAKNKYPTDEEFVRYFVEHGKDENIYKDKDFRQAAMIDACRSSDTYWHFAADSCYLLKLIEGVYLASRQNLVSKLRVRRCQEILRSLEDREFDSN